MPTARSWSSAVCNSSDNRNVDDVTLTLRNLRLQDADLRVMSDDGYALSMHQPWASLLVAGIKRSVLLLICLSSFHSTIHIFWTVNLVASLSLFLFSLFLQFSSSLLGSCRKTFVGSWTKIFCGLIDWWLCSSVLLLVYNYFRAKFYICTTRCYTEHDIAMASCPSVTLRFHGHISWNSSKIISWMISLGCSPTTACCCALTLALAGLSCCINFILL